MIFEFFYYTFKKLKKKFKKIKIFYFFKMGGGGVGRRGADISAFLYLEVWTTMSIIQIQSMKIEIACSRSVGFCIVYSLFTTCRKKCHVSTEKGIKWF